MYIIIPKHFFDSNKGLKSKIIAPPATLTSEMGRNLSSAKSEVQMVSWRRHDTIDTYPDM